MRGRVVAMSITALLLAGCSADPPGTARLRTPTPTPEVASTTTPTPEPTTTPSS